MTQFNRDPNMNTESIATIEKYCKSVEARLASYVDLHIRLTKLAGYSTCPLCESELNRQDTAKLLLLVSEKLAEIRREKEQIDAKNAPDMARKNAERLESESRFKEARDLYIENYKKLFAQYARKYRADPANFTLPDIPVNEREVYNAAIAKWIGDSTSRDDLDEFDFQFDI